MSRLLAGGTVITGERATRRVGLRAKLTLNSLSDRYGPSSLTGADASLLLAAGAGEGLLQFSLSGTDSSPSPMIRPGVSASVSTVDEHVADSPPGAHVDSAADAHGAVDPVEPLEPAATTTPGIEAYKFTPFNAPAPEPAASGGEQAASPPANAAQVSGPTTDGTAAVTFLAFPSDFGVKGGVIPVVQAAGDTAPPTKSPAPADASIPPPANAAAPDPKAPASSADDAVPPAADSSDADSSEAKPSASDAAVETPPTFFHGEVSLRYDKTDEPTSGGSASGLQSMVSNDTFGPEASSGNHVPPVSNAVDPSNLSVTPKPEASGRPLDTDTGVFRISGSPQPGEKLEVRYTLAAHDANGSISVDGSVTLTAGASHATITAGPALAGRSPEILTLIFRDHPGARPARGSATLFLAPAGERISDSALFEAHRLGKSPEAFDALVQRHGAAVTRSCQRIVGNQADAEDVTQFVFLTLAQWELRFPGTLTGWLRTVAKNASLAFLRAKSRRIRHEREVAKPVLADPPDAQSFDDNLDAAIRQLPAPLEEAVRLRYLEGWSQQEAARIVGCPRGTLSRRAAHGIQVLRELLESDRATAG